jgi:glycosyltransferase involved in cell wall biosynthesis
MPTPLVSVCMPIYAPKPEHLREAVESVLGQTETRWALLISEDASKVDAAPMVEPFLKDPRIRYRKNPQRLGIGGNWNSCLKEADAPYVQYVFQDDVLAPTYLARTVEAMEKNPRVGIVAVMHRYVFEGDGIDRAPYDEVQARRKELMPAGTHSGREFLLKWMERGLHPNLIGEPSFVLIRRETAIKAGPFVEDMPQFLDVEYWTRCLLHGDLVVLEGDGGMFRVHQSGASAVNQALGSGLFDRFRTMQAVSESLPASAERRRARRLIADALAGMIRKFLNRKKEGKAVSMSGGGALKSFALKHPFLTFRALLLALGKS